jgi:hypothetical protein
MKPWINRSLDVVCFVLGPVLVVGCWREGQYSGDLLDWGYPWGRGPSERTLFLLGLALVAFGLLRKLSWGRAK